jgi:hypothetical protein
MTQLRLGLTAMLWKPAGLRPKCRCSSRLRPGSTFQACKQIQQANMASKNMASKLRMSEWVYMCHIGMPLWCPRQGDPAGLGQ